MNRRDWLRRAAILAGGAIAADQIELIERLTPKRYVQGWRKPYYYTVRTGLPPVQWRMLNSGVVPNKSRIVQVTREDFASLMQQRNVMLDDIWIDLNQPRSLLDSGM
jgi:hypothetical protein